MGPSIPVRIAALGGVVTAAWLGTGCAPKCGEFEYQTGLEWDIPGDDHPPESVDGYTLHEICGAMYGSLGYRDPGGDGIAQISLEGSHPNSHVSITLTSGMFYELYFQTSAIEIGRTLSLDDLTNQGGVFESTAYVSSDGTVVAGAWLTEGEIEFLDVKPNAFWETDAYRIRYDVTYGEPGTSENWFTAVGEDWIAML